MDKVIEIGYVDCGEYGEFPVTVEISIKEVGGKKKLSIAGEIRHPKHGWLASGQIRDEIQRLLDSGELRLKNYSEEQIRNLLEIWDRWHLNNLRPYCEHQKPIVEKLKKEKGKSFFYADNYDNIIKVPELASCPVCGYRYGSKWMYEPLPDDVVGFLEELVEGKKNMNEELRRALESFTGTQNYYRHFTGLLFTDGVKYLADKAKAYWLIDLIASYQLNPEVRRCVFQFWELTVNEDSSAVITMREDSDRPIIVEQEIPYTDFPLDYIMLYVVDGVLMLPSEY